MKLDRCTSIAACNAYGSTYCLECLHSVFLGEGIDREGKKWRWKFSPMFGPFFLRKDGEELERQPEDGGEAWETFGRWHKKQYGKGWHDRLEK